MSRELIVRSYMTVLLLAGVLAAADVNGQQQPRPGSDGIKMTFVPLTQDANALIAEPPRKDRLRSRIAILIAHPEHINMFNDDFLAPNLARRGYRTMMMNYYGKEQIYEEFLAPLAAAMRYLKSQPGIDKVVLVGHSSGGAELTFYQDVAENGPKACQGPERVYPCAGGHLDNLPKADGIMLLDINIGGPLRAIGIDPAVDNEQPSVRDPEFDMFDSHNGFDANTHTGHYSPEFERRFFAAQQARNERLLYDALGRLQKIERGEGTFKDDEPFTVGGGSVRINGARLDLADRQLLSQTHAPHVFLKADGTSPTQIVPSVLAATASSSDLDRLYDTAQSGTIRHYLSFYGFRTTLEFATTADDIKGIDWRSSANSAPGNIEGITVPTLVMTGTCAAHLVPSEITYDHSPAQDKQFAAVEGADHFYKPCKPQYGDTVKRWFDYADVWLTKAGRF
jgi:pimeloyl-ACP methyl ester carboxylesterase